MEILQKLKEPLKITDVDFRIQSINKGGYATILAYKNARVDMNRLDEVCGAHWQDKYELIDNQLFCSIGIKIDSEWIWRQDVGVESYTEKTKGRASDAFKRAGFRWGIGRELYDYPLIQVKLNSNEFTIEGNKVKQTYNLKLNDWVWNIEFKEGKIIKLTAKDEVGTVRFDSSKTQNQKHKTTQNNTTNSTTKEKELPWLNITDNQNKATKEWVNVVNAIKEGKISSINEIRKHYKVSGKTADQLTIELNSKNQQTA